MAKISIVDDEEAIISFIKTTLGLEGHEVTSFGSGQEFLDSQHIKSCDLLITDVKMPDLDGFELVSCSRNAGFEFPVLAITGIIDVKEEILELDDGRERSEPDILIKKPFSPEDLVLHVNILLGSQMSTSDITG